jgi:hypothetical protein
MIRRAPGTRFHKWGLLLALGFGTIDRAHAAEDPDFPTGPEIRTETRPETSGTVPACSARFPLCVHPHPRLSGASTLAALDAAELAYERLVVVLGLPAPLPDDAGGGSALDLYLAPRDPNGEPVRIVQEPLELGTFDRSAAFCELLESEGVLLERAATLCLGEAVALRLDAAETPHVRRAFATSLWWAVGTPTTLDYEAIAELQSHPERAILGRERNASSEGAALFFEYLEHTRAEGEPGTLAAALLSASAQKTTPGAFRFQNEPDYVDILRHTLDDKRSRLIALFRDFSVARTFVGARDDGLHLPTLGWSGRFGVAPFDWIVPFSSLPRRVLLSKPVEPSGAALIWLDLDQVPAGATLGFRADWEFPVAFAWAFVRIGEDGGELSRVEIPFQQRATSVEARLSELEGAGAIAIVGTFLDEVSLEHPFDPDVEPFEPHSATVYLVRL